MKEKNITHMKLRLKLPRGFLLIRAQSVGTATKNTLLEGGANIRILPFSLITARLQTIPPMNFTSPIFRFSNVQCSFRLRLQVRILGMGP